MKSPGLNRRVALCAVSCALFVAAPACNNGFLGLEDYQRDLIFGGVAAALLGQQAQNGGTGQPIPGADGLSCWDLNGNGQGDPNEDANGDGLFDALDCQGAVGSPGRDGTGANGDRCWNLNGNGSPDAAEDTNGDGSVDVLDCQGSAGTDGSSGGSGSDGLPGPEFFDIFIDDFFKAFGTADGALPVVAISVTEPALGGSQGQTAGDNGVADAIAYRVAIPDSYAAGNDVLMRLMFYRTGFLDGDCFIFTLDALRLRDGKAMEHYGERRWIRVEEPETNGGCAARNAAAFVVVDLVLNSAGSLGFPDDLRGSDFLAFELATYLRDGRLYELLGVEFIEFPAGGGPTSGARVILSEDDVCCFEQPDEPGPGVPDDHLFISDGEMLRVSNIVGLTAVRDIAGTLSNSGGFDDGHHMVFDSAGQRIFVTEHDDPFRVFDTTLTELFPDTDVWVDNLILDEPLGIAPLPDGKLIITDEDADDGLFRLNADLTMDAQASGCFSFDGAEGVAYDAVHDLIFVADEDDGDIEIFDGPSLEYRGRATVSCGSEGPYWIGVDGSTSHVFMVAEGSCFNSSLQASVFGIHVFDIGDCPGDLEFTHTIVGSGGPSRDCYGTLTVSESTDRLFAIDYCTDDAHPFPTVDIFDTMTLDLLESVPVERAGENPLMITVGHLVTNGGGNEEQ